MAVKQAPTVTHIPEQSTEHVEVWYAGSRTHPAVYYTVRYDRLENAWECQCPAYTYRGHCAHLESAIKAQAEAARLDGAA